MEVVVDPRDVGVDSVVWRGGAVLSGLETAQVDRQLVTINSPRRLYSLRNCTVATSNS